MIHINKKTITSKKAQLKFIIAFYGIQRRTKMILYPRASEKYPEYIGGLIRMYIFGKLKFFSYAALVSYIRKKKIVKATVDCFEIPVKILKHTDNKDEVRRWYRHLKRHYRLFVEKKKKLTNQIQNV